MALKRKLQFQWKKFYQNDQMKKWDCKTEGCITGICILEEVAEQGIFESTGLISVTHKRTNVEKKVYLKGKCNKI